MRNHLRLASIILIFVIVVFSASPVFAFETGQASWYGGKFQGGKTANGEIFDTNKLTAAHKTLPFNTIVKVTNLQNDRSVTVRINDRGPFIEGRVIDLSHAAAEQIEMSVSGVALVKLEVVSLPEGVSASTLIKTESVHPEGIPESYKIQIASYSRADNAQSCLKKVKNAGLAAEFELSDSGMMRIIIPSVKKEDIAHIKNLLSDIGFPNPLVRHN